MLLPALLSLSVLACAAQVVPIRLPAPPLVGVPGLPGLGASASSSLSVQPLCGSWTPQDYSRAVESKYRVGDVDALPPGLRGRPEVIGRGSFGSVLLGVDPTRPGVPVAVKRNILFGRLEMMAYEARMLARAAAVDPDGLFVRGEFDPELGVLVMEYLDGYAPLTHWVHARPGPSREALERAASLLSRVPPILRAAGIVHGDLRPDNVLVNERGDVKIIDLGLAAAEGSYNPHLGGQRHGSLQYSSENQRGNGPAAFGDDEYSIAYLLQVVRSRMPFDKNR